MLVNIISTLLDVKDHPVESVDDETLSHLEARVADSTLSSTSCLDVQALLCRLWQELKELATEQRDVFSFGFEDESGRDLFTVSLEGEIVNLRELAEELGALAWKPVYSATLVVIGIALVIGVALLLNRRSEDFHTAQTPLPQVSPATAGQSPSPDKLTHTPTVTPTESPSEKLDSVEAIVVLNDGSGTITVNKSGDVTGLDDLPSPMRDQIAKALLTERIERPAILRDLAGEESALRGSDKQSFRLLSPTRTVIVSNRPTFRWDKVPGATGYRVYVHDGSGREIARSEELPSDNSQWVVAKALKRGEIYTWTVVADVNGKEIVSPGPSSPEMKFRVLSASSLQQLNSLKKTQSHLALGIFYAREGMIAQAEREIKILLNKNPQSMIARKFLNTIQYWQSH